MRFSIWHHCGYIEDTEKAEMLSQFLDLFKEDATNTSFLSSVEGNSCRIAEGCPSSGKNFILETAFSIDGWAQLWLIMMPLLM